MESHTMIAIAGWDTAVEVSKAEAGVWARHSDVKPDLAEMEPWAGVRLS